MMILKGNKAVNLDQVITMSCICEDIFAIYFNCVNNNEVYFHFDSEEAAKGAFRLIWNRFTDGHNCVVL